MRFIKRIFKKSRIYQGIVAIGLALAATPLIASAQAAAVVKAFVPGIFELTNISYGAISYLFFEAGWVIGTIAGFFVVIETYAVEQILTLSFNIIKSPIVTLGFPIALSVANLAFVGGLIVIAVTTILKIENYGLKNILWKVIVMAVLVNFGLIISGTILGFSDNITSYLITSISPAGNGSITDFATDISSAFNPQNLLLNTTKSASQSDIDAFQKTFNANSSTGDYLKPIVGIFLTIMTYVIILIVMGSLAAVLLYRYIILSLLIVGLPLMWAAWPFPSLSKHFTDWWHKFFSQAFAPVPIVFFLWLGLIVAQRMNNVQALVHPITKNGQVVATAGTPGYAIGSFLTGLIAPSLDSFMEALLLGGILSAGLVIAGKMGAAFAVSGSNMIKSMQNKVTKGVSSRAKRLGSNYSKQAGLAIKGSDAGLAVQKGFFTARQKLATAKEGITNKILRNNITKITPVAYIYKKDGTAEYVKDANGNDQLDASGNKIRAMAVIDPHTGQWKKDDQGNLLDQNGNFHIKSQAKVDYAQVRDQNGVVVTLNNDQLKSLGLTKDGQMISTHANIKTDSNGNIVTANPVATPTSAKMEEKVHKIDNGDTKREIKFAAYGLDKEAAESHGVIRSFATDVVSDMITGGTGGGAGGDAGHAAPKKDSTPKPPAGGHHP